MKVSYQDILGQYVELYNDQPEEVKEEIEICSDIKEDESIQEVISFLNRQETTYNTYSHS